MYSHVTEGKFIYGVATSSYQIEGCVDADGAGLSNWTVFSHNPGNVAMGHTGDIACNHYQRWAEDIALMKKLGVQSYRFSLSWSRIFPDDSGTPNLPGLQHYLDFTKSLVEAGIEPMITLYHWDLPQWIEDQGGWSNPKIIHYFSEYANITVEWLSPYCAKWITLNEPWVFLHKGFITGEHAPGYKDLAFAAKAYVNILKSHTKATRSMKERNQNIEIGIACNLTYIHPFSESQADLNIAEVQHSYQNELFLDPWIKGCVPKVAIDLFGSFNQEIHSLESSEIALNHDFLGINYYSRSVVKYEKGAFLDTGIAPKTLHTTAMDWEVYPDGFTQILDWCYNRYQTPIYVTENGAAYDDHVDANGSINDTNRISYFDQHLKACYKSIANGSDIRGYYAWSLLDNFEWELGYLRRFGLIHVDFETLERKIKNSGWHYREHILRMQNTPLTPQTFTESYSKS
jgi:beta-glucosidase